MSWNAAVSTSWMQKQCYLVAVIPQFWREHKICVSCQWSFLCWVNKDLVIYMINFFFLWTQLEQFLLFARSQPSAAPSCVTVPFSVFGPEALPNYKNSSVVFAHMVVKLTSWFHNFVHFLKLGTWQYDKALFCTYDMLSFILQRYDWGCSYQRQERSYSWTEILTRWEFPSRWFQWQLCGYIWCCSAIQESRGMYWIFKFHHPYGLVFRQ